jgi:hypothetical protein
MDLQWEYLVTVLAARPFRYGWSVRRLPFLSPGGTVNKYPQGQPGAERGNSISDGTDFVKIWLDSMRWRDFRSKIWAWITVVLSCFLKKKVKIPQSFSIKSSRAFSYVRRKWIYSVSETDSETCLNITLKPNLVQRTSRLKLIKKLTLKTLQNGTKFVHWNKITLQNEATSFGDALCATMKDTLHINLTETKPK